MKYVCLPATLFLPSCRCSIFASHIYHGILKHHRMQVAPAHAMLFAEAGAARQAMSLTFTRRLLVKPAPFIRRRSSAGGAARLSLQFSQTHLPVACARQFDHSTFVCDRYYAIYFYCFQLRQLPSSLVSAMNNIDYASTAIFLVRRCSLIIAAFDICHYSRSRHISYFP
jgi:hypothetical protein